MKLAIGLLIIGLVVGLAVPHWLQEIVTGVEVKLPQLTGSTSPPRIYKFSVLNLFRGLGIFLVMLAVLRVLIIQGDAGK